MRFVARPDFPEEGQLAYACFPYDDNKQAVVEELGKIKVATGHIKPHPEDENKIILNVLEKYNLKYVPNFAIKGMMKKMGSYIT